MGLTSFLPGFLRPQKLPSLDWVQVEISTYCNAECVYCPRTVYRDIWRNRHLSTATFERLLPALGQTSLVFLQGWGEPFLNPDFFRMIRAAKEAGCRVGTSTNGMLLDTSAADRLVEYGLDVLAVSLAGVDEANDAIRRGTSLKGILESVRILNQTKQAMARGSPKIHVAYMLMRSGLRDVLTLPAVLRGLGVSQVVISTLDFVPCEELEDEAIIPSDLDEYYKIRNKLWKVRQDGEREGIDIHFQIRRPGGRRITCTERVHQALFVSADGQLSPCVFTNLPVGEGTQLYCGSGRHYQRLTFGDVNLLPLEAIWNRAPYRSFRKAFLKGTIPSVCEGCPKLLIG